MTGVGEGDEATLLTHFYSVNGAWLCCRVQKPDRFASFAFRQCMLAGQLKP